jgi:hypothetical protein
VGELHRRIALLDRTPHRADGGGEERHISEDGLMYWRRCRLTADGRYRLHLRGRIQQRHRNPGGIGTTMELWARR